MDVDPSEEREATMDQKDLDEPVMQEMDMSKEMKRKQDPMNTLVVVGSLDIQITPHSKEPMNTPQWLEAVVGKK